ncbi:MAG TPA: cobalamin-independent methionine synthase II family protein, partial [Dehalococcoidia bacterium]|nr:cobalamin-independent methionine synthase II family protein [Dehalococcoidia bacterium]
FERARQSDEPVDQAAYEKVLAQAVEDVVRKQVEAGIDIVDDGEFSKSSWGTYINGRVTGFQRQEGRSQPINYRGRDSERFAEFFATPAFASAQGMQAQATAVRSARWTSAADVCIAPITYNDQRIRQDVINLREAASKAGATESFLAVVAPASAAFNAINEYYKTEEEYVYAMADALKQEYEAIDAAGILVQADDAVLANAYDYLMEISPERYRQWAELRIEALNYALANIPEEHVRYHLCYGSWHAPHVADAPLEDIVDLIIKVKAQAYSLEAANVRHEHEWRVWEDVKLPEGRMLIPGVVTHHTLSVEHPRLVADRLVRYAKVVGRENVIAGTDCGFAQGAFTQRVHPTIQWAKLESLVEGARIASAELWGKNK